MPAEKKPGDQTIIIITLITSVAAIIGAILASPVLIEHFKTKPSPAPSPTATSTPQPDNTYPPLPLEDVFRQVGEGREFVYTNDPSRPETLKTEFIKDENCRHTGKFGLKLTYRFPARGYGGWGVGWRRASAGPFNASGFTHLKFWVKGLAGNERFQVGLKDMREKETKLGSNSLGVNMSNWSEVYIPLNRFTDVDLKNIENINFSFDHTDGHGNVCIDDIAFIK